MCVRTGTRARGRVIHATACASWCATSGSATSAASSARCGRPARGVRPGRRGDERSRRASRAADRLVMPGQGGFGDCARALTGSLGDAVREHLRGRAAVPGHLSGAAGPLRVERGGAGLRGARRARRATCAGCRAASTRRRGRRSKIPHVGWNTVDAGRRPPRACSAAGRRSTSTSCTASSSCPRDPRIVAATTDYGEPFVSAVARGNLFACQFHPEKSAARGSRAAREVPGVVIVIPAIDLLGGKAVRLRAGALRRRHRLRRRTRRRARALARQGAAAPRRRSRGRARRARPAQHDAVRAIVEAFGPGVQVGGGVRTREDFDGYLAAGATRVVLGSAAVHDPGDGARARAASTRACVVVAVDARDGFVAVDGWTQATRVRAVDLVRALGRRAARGRPLHRRGARRHARGAQRRGDGGAGGARAASRSSRRAASARSTTCARSRRAASPRASSAARSTRAPSRWKRPSRSR